MALRYSLVCPLLYFQAFYAAYQSLFNIVKLATLIILENDGWESTFMATSWTLALLLLHLYILLSTWTEKALCLRRDLSQKRLARGQGAKLAVFGISLMFPSAAIGHYFWRWRDHHLQLIPLLAALASAGIGAIYGVACCSQQGLKLDEENLEITNLYPELVVLNPQRNSETSQHAPLAPRIAFWITSPTFGKHFLRRNLSAKETTASTLGNKLLTFCLAALNIVLLLPKWIMGAFALSLISCWDTCDRFDVPNDLHSRIRGRSTHGDTNIDDKNYRRLPIIPKPYSDRPNQAAHEQATRDRMAGIEQIHRTPHLLTHTPGPRYLCFLDDTTDAGYSVKPNNEKFAEYVFISYTTAQFRNIVEDRPLPLEQEPEEGYQSPKMRRDRKFLTRAGIDAAKRHGVAAFWIDFECIKEESTHSHDPGFKEDVYRICDVIRASRHMVIVVGPPLTTSEDHGNSTSPERWLRDWGKRLWTVPEALLCPSQHDIEIVTFDSEAIDRVAKRNLAPRVWDPSDPICRLIQNYESSCPLTPREVFTIILPCMKDRATTKKMDADFIYALQGLVRQRLVATARHSDFTAFAQLCIENDTQHVLESILCLRPQKPEASWHDLGDVWGARLWDVKPDVQLSSVDVNSESTVEMGGSLAALINWSDLAPVQVQSSSSRHWKCWHAVHLSSVLMYPATAYLTTVLLYACLVTSVPQFASHELDTAYINAYCVAAGIVGLIASMISPYVWIQWCENDITPVQARFYGIEGEADLAQVEAAIFGWPRGQIKWEEGTTQPQADLEVLQDFQTYTLVDTITMTAFKFSAAKPPSAVMAFGKCAGQVRAVLCSFNPDTHSLTRETVLRMDTRVLDGMHQVGQFRFSVNL